MILLDTDHVSALKYDDDPRCERLTHRLDAARAADEIATTIITVEEQMRGWLARVHSERQPHRQIAWYQQLAGLFDFYETWTILQFDQIAADALLQLQRLRVRIGTHDLKIASIA